MTKKTDELGRRGEVAAERFLEARGLTLLERNWREPSIGEVDLILREKQQIVFVEVRTRMGGPDEIHEVISPIKLARLRRLAAAWLRKADGFFRYRIDLVGVAPDARKERAELHWWKGIDR